MAGMSRIASISKMRSRPGADKIDLLVGGRYASAKIQSASGGLPNPGTVTETYADKTTGRYGIVLHPVDNVTVYASHMESFIFNSGTIYNGSPEVPSVGNDNEFGAKAELFGGAIMVTATYFNLTLTNVAIPYTETAADPNPGLTGIIQEGKERNKGEDLSFIASKNLRRDSSMAL